jgi:Sulfotransferase family
LSGKDVTVIYVISLGRSGSTILGNVLGEIDGFVHAGELRTIWGQGLQRDRLCGCGVPIRRCEFWKAVLDAVDLRSLGVDAEAVFRWQSKTVRLRRTPRLIWSTDDDRLGHPLCAYVDIQTKLYRAIADVTGCRVIVDSSKRAADAALLGLLPGIASRYVQLVRDPRAVAFSWQRVKTSPGERRRQEMMRYSPWVSTRSWLALHLAAEAIARRRGRDRFLTLRYEDFVASPRAAVERIADLAGESCERLPFLDDRTVYLSGNHTAGGNPDRLKMGGVRLIEDNEWVVRQSRAHRLLVTAGTSPLLSRYGYPLWPTPELPNSKSP